MNKKLFILSLILLLVGCSSTFDPWDKLGGGGIADVGSSENISLDDYDNLSENINSGLLNDSIDSSNYINLSSLESLPIGVSYSNSTLLIDAGGTYLLTGSMTGQIEVGASSNQDIRLIFDNVNLTGNSTKAPIIFKSSDGLRTITLKENTISVIKDSSINSGSSADESVIEAKNCVLSINGKGTLRVNAVGSNSTGIESNSELYIVNSVLEINAKNNGIRANKKVVIEESKIQINAQNDGMKTHMVGLNVDDANLLATSIENGAIYIKNSDIDIVSKGDGISANSLLYIENQENNLISITSNGGTPSNITESSSSNSSGKALKVEGIYYLNGNTEINVISTHEGNYSLIINGGRYTLDANGDGIGSVGNTIIENGELNITAGDDGIHSDYVTTIRNGIINVNKSYEGIEGASVEIYNGDLYIFAMDDAINASNSSLKDYDFHIYIAGGDLLINSVGDGIDSNGWIEITGGNIYVNGPTSGMNGALDSDKGILVKAGNIVAVGSRGMVETPSTNSTQCYINVNLSSSLNDKITIYDSNSKEIFAFEPDISYQSIVISLEQFKLNNKYTVVVGNNTYEATLTKIGTALGVSSSGGSNQGAIPGGRPPRK